MSHGTAISSGVVVPRAGPWTAPDARRRLQLVLAAIWLLDAILQFQSAMFTRAFSRMLAGTAAGSPSLLARPIVWSAGLIAQHAMAANTVFAVIQLLLGLGLAWRPVTRIALAASMAWAFGVWWLGEGFGGIFTGAASPVSGAPGAALLYLLLAVLLWPARRDRTSPSVAGRAVGTRAAQALWLALWGGLAALALQPAARAPGAISGMISAMSSGQPRWLAWLDSHTAAVLARQGLVVSVLLAVVLAAVAAGPYLPSRWTRITLVAAVAVAALIWLAEGLGGVLTGMGTDPNSGPLLILLALAYWPRPAAVPGPAPAAEAVAP
jgi:hypothetical protein